MAIPEKYKTNILYKYFNKSRLLYFKVLVFLKKINFIINKKPKKNILKIIKKRILQEKILFKEFGFNNYFIRINKKINSLKFEKKIKNFKNHRIKINKEKINNILIISGCENTGAEIHRVFHLSEKLKLIKIKYKIIPHSKLDSYNPNELIDYDLIWIHRAASEKKIDAIISLWKSLNIPIVYDIDDLVFDRKIIPYISAIKNWSKEKKELYGETMDRYSFLIKKCDFVSSPTQFLSNYLSKKYNKKYFVVRNGIDNKSFINLQKIKPNILDNKIILGYFSGTNTHNKDFQECSNAICKLMEKHKNLFLKIVGELEIPKELEYFSERIIKKPLIAYQKLFEEYKDITINLAPLEVNNPYCESKSELKYYFAGFCGIPTVASPTDSFKFAIEDSTNGFLAKDKKEWFQKIDKLILDKKLYKKISYNCKLHTNNIYSPSNQAKELEIIINSIKTNKK